MSAFLGFLLFVLSPHHMTTCDPSLAWTGSNDDGVELVICGESGIGYPDGNYTVVEDAYTGRALTIHVWK